MQPIAHIHTDFPTKFGVPRQSGLVDRLTSANSRPAQRGETAR